MVSDEKCPPPASTGKAGETRNQSDDITTANIINGYDLRTEFLLALLDGATHATALMPWGERKPGPIRLPDDPVDRRSLIRAHLRGDPATVRFAPVGRPEQIVKTDPLVLGAYSPATDGLVRWLGIDLDGASHGPPGLADPIHAGRCIAERINATGLADGLIVARSKSAAGRHCWLILPYPVALADAVIAVAQLAVQAHKVAIQDVEDGSGRHAFLCVDGSIAKPGESGKVELIPRGDVKPAVGWALTMPLCGAFQSHGGGALVDPFADRPVTLQRVPGCNADAWKCFLQETQVDFVQRAARAKTSPPRRQFSALHRGTAPIERLPAYVREFIEGNVPEGDRGNRAFVAACAMFGCGLPLSEVEILILQGARRCVLPEREARSAIQSAARRKGVRA